MLRTLSLRRAEKKVIGLKGSSYYNQEFFDITNVNELIKIFGIIFFTYEKHFKENNSIYILKAATPKRNYWSPYTLKLLLNKYGDGNLIGRFDKVKDITGTTPKLMYHIYSNKRRRAYLIFCDTSAALIRGRRFFKHCTRQINFYCTFIQLYTFYLLIFL